MQTTFPSPCFYFSLLLCVTYFENIHMFMLAYRRCYIRFIRKVNEKKGVEGQEETRKAFDFMLSHVGVSSPFNF